MDSKTDIFYRYLNNECTPDEIEALLAQFNTDTDDEVLRGLILEQLQNNDVPEGFEQRPDVIDAFNQTDHFLAKSIFIKKNRNTIKLTWAAVAASIILCFTLGYLFIRQDKPIHLAQEIIDGRDAKPGTDRAILTLANGVTINLDEKADGTVLSDAGLTIKKTSDGTLIYEAERTLAATGKLVYNQLSTPYGAKYKVILPDGTLVWLNAGSSLRYPTSFAASERRVELKGEAFFDVEKLTNEGKRIPFYVETPTQIVQVLGTEFNISAYEDDDAVKTTLISGKVNVSNRKGDENEILNPGYQSVLSNRGSFQVIKVNTETAQAWKNGNFMFEDMYLKDIMKQLCRWYNVKVDDADIPHTTYNVFISRNETLSSVLNMLGRTGNLKFQLNNNQIKITK